MGILAALNDSVDRFLVWWGGFVAHRAAFVAGLCLVLAVLGAIHVSNTLDIDTDTDDMISAEVPFRRNNIALEAAFPQFNDFIIAVIDGPTPEQAEDAAARLAQRLAMDTDVFANVRAPSAAPFFRRHGLLYLDIEELEDVSDRMVDAAPLLAALAADPTLRGLTGILRQSLADADISADSQFAAFLDSLAIQAESARNGAPGGLSWRSLLAGDLSDVAATTRSLVIAQPRLAFESLDPGAAALAAVRRAAADLGIVASEGYRLRLTGDAAVDQEELESVSVGGRIAALASLFLVTLLLVLGLRSFWLVLAAVVTLLAGLIWTAVFVTLTIGTLNLISVAFAVLFIGLGVDFGIHLSLRYREARAGSQAPRAAVRTAVAAIGGSLTLSAVAAAAGFFAFLPTDYRGLAELGLIAGVGMFIALLASLALLPALLALLPGIGTGDSAGRWTRPVIARRWYRLVVVLAAGLGVACLAALPLVHFDFNPLNLKDPSTESVAAFLELAEDPATTPYAIDVLVDDTRAAAALGARLEALEEVETTISVLDFVPSDQTDKLFAVEDLALLLLPVLAARKGPAAPDAQARLDALADLETLLQDAKARVPGLAVLNRLSGAISPLQTPALAEAFEARVFANFPALLALLEDQLAATQVSLDTLPADLQADWVSADGRLRLQVRPAGGIAANADLRRFAQAVTAIVPSAAGVPVTVTAAADTVLASFKEATLIALVSISVILFLVLRRLDDVLLVLAPLALAALLTIAASVVLNLPFNFANVIVLPLLLGLGVASAIHLVLRRRAEGDGGAVMATSTPRAVLFSSLTTVAAFGSLMLSRHPGMVSMGQLLAISIAFTLLSTLIVLPALMTWLDRLAGHGSR